METTQSKEKRPLLRNRVCIDTKIVHANYKHIRNQVEWGLFTSTKPPAEALREYKESGKATGGSDVCFGGLLGEIRSSKANRMYFRMEVDKEDVKKGAILLSDKERRQWIVLAKKHKLLPPYIKEDAIKDLSKEKSNKIKGNPAALGEFVIDLDNLSPTVLYIYLSTLRNIREMPGFVRVVSYLVLEKKMNFYAAYLIASKIVITVAGHHIIREQRPYGKIKSTIGPNGLRINEYLTQEIVDDQFVVGISTAIGMFRVVNNDPLKYDKRNLHDPVGSKVSYYGFNCADNISKISNAKFTARMQDLFDKDIAKAITSKDDAEAHKHIKIYKDKKPRIRYREASK